MDLRAGLAPASAVYEIGGERRTCASTGRADPSVFETAPAPRRVHSPGKTWPAFAGIVAGSGSDAPLALPFIGEEYEAYAGLIGAVVFAALVAWLYARTKRAAA